MLVAALFWPGVAEYDTVAQYREVLTNVVDDWHPPVMVRLWQVLHPLAGGMAPMFVLQTGLYAFGFGLIVSAFAGIGRPRAALATALLALSPLLLGWQMVVLKDGQMSGAMISAVGVVAHYRLSGRRIPALATILLIVALNYATLVRANAIFATAPLAILLLPKPASTIVRFGLVVGITAGVVAVSPLINQRLFGAAPSGIAKSQPVFDLAAIATAAPGATPFTPAERQLLASRHCVKAFFWDPLGDPTACGPVTGRLKAQKEGDLYLELARAAIGHPVDYAEHRVRHWNSTERWLVSPGLISADPPDEAEPNNIGLTTPANALVPAWQDAASLEEATPLGWPILWTTIAAILLVPAWRRRDQPDGGMALALAGSALSLEASFLFFSIASDLRYHLWPMTASALALILLSNDLKLRRPERIAAIAAIALIAAAGIASREILPSAPDTYQGMIHAVSG